MKLKYLNNTLILTAISAVLIILSFPPFNKTGFLAYVALVPLFLAIERTRTPFRIGMFCGIIYFYGLAYWVALADVVLIPVSVLMVLYLSLYPAVFSFLLHKLWIRSKLPLILVAPIVWVMVEYGMALTDMAFPWLLMGYTQNKPLSLLQFISFTGIWGLSFLVIFINTLIFTIIKHYRKKKVSLIAGISILLALIIPIIYGISVLNADHPVEKKANVAVLQANLPQNVKWLDPYEAYAINAYLSLSHSIAKNDTLDLIVWPETAAACNLRYKPRYIAQIQKTIQEIRVPMLLGTLDQEWVSDEDYCDYNSAFFFAESGYLTQKFEKIKLVPFSERFPYDDKIPKFRDLKLGSSDFCKGDEQTIFQIEDFKFSAEICFEVVFPDFTRKYVLNDADFLVNITNDAWWLNTSGPYQHASIVKFRAIENRVSIARAANTGVSFFVDPFGRETGIIPLFEKGASKAELPVLAERTFYTKHGDWLPRCCGIGTLILIVIAILKKILPKRFTAKARRK